MSLFKPNKEFDKKRQEANMALVQKLYEYLEKYPSIRFGQAVHNLDLVEYNEEPMSMLARLEEKENGTK